MIALFAKKFPSETQALVDGRAVTIAVRVSARARSYRLSIPHSGGPVLTVPSHGRWGEAEAFLNRQTGWLEARLKHAAPAVSFAEGAVIPLRGVDHVLVATGKLRGRVEPQHGATGPSLLIPGEPEHHARRLIDWMKTEAHGDLSARCTIHARRLGVSFKSISMRSQATRWGSCSSRGSLNFNWRLVMAPPFVLDYVAAHEVAHLVEMNHSQAFWDTVERTLPEMDRGRAWLKAHGRTLMAYGNG
jgi:predicted metal-dependent hydrolase